MARQSMQNLINLVRDLIGDAAETDSVFSDDQIERSLDAHCQSHFYLPLAPVPAIVNGNEVQLEWSANDGYWESDAKLYDASYNQINPVTGDYLTGRWAFATSQNGVVIFGKTYDVYGAAADLLETWASLTATEFDFSADGGDFKRSQKSKALLELATEYRKKQRVKQVKQVRNDVWP